MVKVYGLDLSKHNGRVNFRNIKKAGNDFVILRAGYGTEYEDPQFQTYYQQAIQSGLRVGAYWYSYALNEKQALQEAQKCLSVIKNKKFEYPIYIDMEDADGYKRKNGMPTNQMLVDICEIFCKTLQDNNFYTGIYASESWFDNQLKGLKKNQYDQWVANWGSNNGTLQSDKSSKYRMHQFTSEYRLEERRYDRNVCYYDYPSVIREKGLNGFQKVIDKPIEIKPTPQLFQIGEKIKIKNKAKDLNTKKQFSDFVYQNIYVVISYTKERLVLGTNLNAVTGVINPTDAIKVKINYYPQLTSSESSLVDGLKKLGIDSSFNHRQRIALINGIKQYNGTAQENTRLLDLLKKGLLIQE